jgi:O-antigen/teichoic acid export membrane protein
MILLQAEGKNYIITSMNMATNVFKNVAKIVLISQHFDVVFVQMIAMIISLIQMIYIQYYIGKKYQWIDLKSTPNFGAISQSKNVFVHQISFLVFNNTDTILLTFFCGLKTVSVYSMYTMLFSMIKSALTTVTNSVCFALGQTFHTDRERYLKLHDCFELYNMTLYFALFSVANFFVLPFLKCYTRGVSDISYIDPYLPNLFIATYLLVGGRTSCNQAINFAGHFKQTQDRAVIEMIINLIVSIVSVKIWGIYGVLVGTIAALLYRTNDMIIYSNKRILFRSPWITYKRWGINFGVFIFILIVNSRITWVMNDYLHIFLYCIPYTVATLFIYIGIISLSEPKTAKFALTLLKQAVLVRREKYEG